MANEAATMTWAAAAGFRTAEVRVRAPPPLDPELGVAAGVESVLLVRRYDRVDGKRIHQEDLAQATWLDPTQKYPRTREDRRLDSDSETRREARTTVEGLGRWVAQLLGPAGFEEYLRRFVFVVASGNGDAHLKNWSIQYPDPRKPTWTPLYDQVATVAWQEETLACPLFGTRNFAGIRVDALVRMSEQAGLPEPWAREVIAETLERCRSAWATADTSRPFPPDHRARLVHHWTAVPLLRPHGPLR